jgi:hypothetical protein
MIGVDGEGIGDRYVLLADSTGRVIRRRSGLSTIECLDFLLSAPRGILVGFGWDYDVNMILRDLEDPRTGKPGPEARELWRAGRTEWQGYRIRYVPRKLFGVKFGRRSATVYDIMSFFACSFVRALERFGIEVPEIIREGKQARERFSSWQLDDIERYNAEECRALAALAEELRRRLEAGGLVPTRWHGPGAVATTWLRRVGARAWVAPEPEPVEDAARRAYFGGRIDAVGYGMHPAAHRSDLRSAYPWALTLAPDLAHGRWRRARRSDDPAHVFGIFRVRWDDGRAFPRWWGLLPWRDDDGTILWPPAGEGWYHGVEIEAARVRRAVTGGVLHIEEGWVWEPRDPGSPWAGPVRTLYRERERRKRAGDPSELAYKLVLNSLYGKAAQRRGVSPIASWALAGYITAAVRARISEAIASVENRGGTVYAVMTDGILADLRIRSGRGLGSWSYEGRAPLVLVEPGVYIWGDRLYSRGYEGDASPDLPALVRSWISGREDREMAASVRRFIGLGLAVEVNGVYRWRSWLDIDRAIASVPLLGTSKRAPAWDGSERRGDMVMLRPYAIEDPRTTRLYPSGITLSAPYEPRMLDPDARIRALQDEVVPEDR